MLVPSYHSIFHCKTNLKMYQCNKCNVQTDLGVFRKVHIKICRGITRKTQNVDKYTVRSYICRQCDFETHFLLKWLQYSTSCCVGHLKDIPKVAYNDSLKQFSCRQCSFKTKYAYKPRPPTLSQL